MTPSSDTNVKITTSLIPAPRVVAGTLREANTGSPIRVTDSRGARLLGLPSRPRKSSIWRPCECGAGPLQCPHADQRSGASFLFLGSYYHETHKISAKTATNIRSIPQRKPEYHRQQLEVRPERGAP